MGARATRRSAVVAAGAVVAALLAAASAQAAVRYASPSGLGSGTCSTPANACDLDTAVEDPSVNNGDEVVLAVGTYHPVESGGNALHPSKKITIRGVQGPEFPEIHSAASSSTVSLEDGSTLRDVAVSNTGTGSGVFASSGATLDRVAVFSTGTDACEITGALVRNSSCLDTAASGDAVYVESSLSQPVAQLRNVTTVATGPASHGLHVYANGTGDSPHLRLEGRNVIAQGVSADLFASTNETADKAEIALDHSNFKTTDTSGLGTKALPSSSAGGNQSAEPLFVDLDNADLRQRAGSPTIDAGSPAPDPLLGSLDLYLKPRVVDGNGDCAARVDIGSDEFPAPASAAQRCAPPPPPPPSNEFTIGKVKGTKLTVTVPGPGEVEVRDQADSSSRAVATAAKKKKGLKHSSATASGAGDVKVKLKLTGTAKRKLKAKRKVKVKASVSFTPTGGDPSTQADKLKLKKKK